MNICKFLKRSLSLLLVLMMCVSLMSLSAFAANEETPTQYACGLEEHKHTDECYEIQTVDTLICDLEEIEGHQHDSSCYVTQITETEEQVLTCDEEHEHTEDCYAVQTVTVEEEVLTCQLAEAEGHTHSEDCYDTTTVTTLVCGKEEHTHTAECVAEETAVEEIPSGIGVFADSMYAIMDLQNADAEAEEILAAVEAAWAAYDALSEDEKADEMVAMMYEVLVAFGQTMTLAINDTVVEGSAYNIYSVTFPRGSWNLTGVQAAANWGHPAVNYKGEPWSIAANSSGLTVHAVATTGSTTYAGRVAYCIEPGVSINNLNSNWTVQNGSSWKYDNGVISTSEMRTLVGRIMQYGYQGTVASSWSDTSANRNNLAKLYATQLLIWETVVGERNADFSKNDTFGSVEQPVLTHLKTENPLNSLSGDDVKNVMGWYDDIVQNVKNQSAKPGKFDTTYDLTWDGRSYSTTQTGFSGYSIVSHPDDVTATINSGTLTITSSTPLNGTVDITLSKNVGKTQSVLVWLDGATPGAGQQNLTTYGGTIDDVVQGKISVKTSTTDITVSKDWSPNTPDNIKNAMTVTVELYQGNNSVKTATLNRSNNWSQTFSDLPAGSYSVKETGITFIAGSGYTALSENGGWTVYSGNTAVGAFKPSVSGTTVTNTWTDATEAGTGTLTFNKVGNTAYGPQNVPLSGAKFMLTSDTTTKTATSNNGTVTFSGNNGFTLNDVGTWTLKETTAPDGYNANDTEWTVTVAKGAFTGNVTYSGNTPVNNYNVTATISGAENGLTVVNDHKVANLQVTKTVTWNPTSSQTPPADSVFTFDVTLGGGTERKTGSSYIGAGVYTLTTTLTQDDIAGAKDNSDGTKTATCEVQTITGIPTGTTYTVEERSDVTDAGGNTVAGFSLDGYVDNDSIITINAESASTTVKNRYFKTVLTSINGYKDWNGVPENLWPESITVALYQDGTKFDMQNVYAPENGGTKWTYSWKDLPQYKAENDEYTYTVKEVSVNYGEDSVYTADAREENTDIIRVRSNIVAENGTDKEILGGWIITDGQNMNVVNKWLPASELGNTSFTIEKLDSLEETPINGVTFKLTKTENGVADGTDEDGNDAVRKLTTGEEGIVKFSYLTDGTYTLTEIAVPEGYRTDDINVGRTWTINIIKENLATVDEIDGPNILGENTWNWKPVDDNGEDAGTLTITNAPIMGQISVTKTLDLDGVTDGITGEPADKVFTFEVWATEDVLGADLTKPVATLEVKMGETATTELLRYGTYIVKEVGNPEELTDYKWQSVTYTQGSIDSATEEMVNNLAEAVTDALNEVLDRETEEDITTVSANTVMVGEQDVTYAVTATNHYKRDLGELSISKTVQGDLGDQNKEWHFTVTLTSPEEYVQLAEQYEVTYSANKSVADEEAEDAEEVEPDYLTFTAQEDGTYVSAEIVLKHGETATIQGIPVGTTYKVTEAEANKDGYSTSATDDTGVIVTGATEAKFYNSRWSVPTTSLTVNKVWEDDGHEDERPDSIQVQLYRNGNAYGNPVTLNADNGWSQRWTGLSTNGAWTVEELNVPHGYTVTMEQSGTVVTITNTYEEEEEEDLDDPDVPLAEMPDDPEEPDDSDDSDNSDGPDEEFLDDPDVPLAGVPDMPEEEELDDPDVPLAEMPSAPEEEELDDPDVPLAEMPGVPEEEDQEELEELTDLDVPLAEVPKTGDRSGLWYALSAAAAAGLLGLTAVERKKREED